MKFIEDGAPPIPMRLKALLFTHDQLLGELEKLMKEIDRMLAQKPEPKDRMKLIKLKAGLIRTYDRQLKNEDIKKLREQVEEIEELMKAR